MARASSAAIQVEAKAAHTEPGSPESSDPVAEAKIETDAAKYENGEVILKGNPLQTIKELLCPSCGLRRLLYPTEGKGARAPEPGVEYCKKRPFVDKGPYYDIYGQTFEQAGPGRGKKKKDMVNPLLAQTSKEGTPTGGDSSPTSNGLVKPIPFPSAKCEHCNKHLSIKRMNNHMNNCIGGGGREASRNALSKIQNGNGNGSNGNTPPGSRNGTPIPGAKRSSPNKRSPGDDFDSDTPKKKTKIIIKKTATTKLKAPKMVKSASQHSASNLSFESRVPNSEDEDDENDENDDERDGDFGSTIAVEAKKKIKPIVKKKDMVTQKKWMYGKAGKGGGKPPILPPDVILKVKHSTGGDGDSPESSQTLSSPNE